MPRRQCQIVRDPHDMGRSIQGNGETQAARHLGFDTKYATRTMLQIHTKGGALLALKTPEAAEQIASAITLHAKDRGYRNANGRAEGSRSHVARETLYAASGH